MTRILDEQSSDLQRQRKTRPLYPRHGTRNGKNDQFSLAGPAGLFALFGRGGQRLSTPPNWQQVPRNLPRKIKRGNVAHLPEHCYRGTTAAVSRVFSGNGTAMSEMQDDQNTKSKFAVKHEESLELLKAFLMIEDPKLRADIISMVKQTARVQPKR